MTMMSTSSRGSKNLDIQAAVLTGKNLQELDIPAKRTFIDPWLTEQSITLISGWRGVGKSWFALSLLDAISKGQPFGPWEAGDPVSCLFLDGEMPILDTKERVEMLGADKLLIYSSAYANLLGLPRVNLRNYRWRKEMQAFLKDHFVKVWVIDNIASLDPEADENTKKDWGPINSWLLDLRFAGIATILLHHTNKEGGQRGTSAREDNIDNSIILNKSFDYTSDEGCRFTARFVKSRVRTRDLNLISDTQFHLREDEQGKPVWTYGSVKNRNRGEILKLTDEGQTTREIASAVGVSQQYVNKTQIQARKDGYLTSKNTLSQSGFALVNDG